MGRAEGAECMGGPWNVVLALAMAGGLAGCAASDSVPLQTGRFEGNATLATLSGSGIIAKDKDPIAYRPRSPLVLPQKYELRSPEAAQMAAVSNPAWPRDADIERKRKDKEHEALSLEEHRRQQGTSDDRQQVLLSRDEMEKGRRQGANVVTEPVRDRRDGDVWMLPSDYKRKKTAEDVEQARIAASTVEAPRKYLTEPPTGYRAPVAATTAEGKKAAEEAIKVRQEQAAKPSDGKSWTSWFGL